jgi:hypothetical protein
MDSPLVSRLIGASDHAVYADAVQLLVETVIPVRAVADLVTAFLRADRAGFVEQYTARVPVVFTWCRGEYGLCTTGGQDGSVNMLLFGLPRSAVSIDIDPDYRLDVSRRTTHQSVSLRTIVHHPDGSATGSYDLTTKEWHALRWPSKVVTRAFTVIPSDECGTFLCVSNDTVLVQGFGTPAVTVKQVDSYVITVVNGVLDLLNPSDATLHMLTWFSRRKMVVHKHIDTSQKWVFDEGTYDLVSFANRLAPIDQLSDEFLSLLRKFRLVSVEVTPSEFIFRQT